MKQVPHQLCWSPGVLAQDSYSLLQQLITMTFILCKLCILFQKMQKKIADFASCSSPYSNRTLLLRNGDGLRIVGACTPVDFTIGDTMSANISTKYSVVVFRLSKSCHCTHVEGVGIGFSSFGEGGTSSSVESKMVSSMSSTGVSITS